MDQDSDLDSAGPSCDVSETIADDDLDPSNTSCGVSETTLGENGADAQPPVCQPPSADGSKSHGTRKTLHGILYQMKLSMLFLHNALRNEYEFDLYCENENAEKFDDTVFRYHRDGLYRFLQAKHKLNTEKDKITLSNLLSDDTKSPFSLEKYFISFRNLRKKFDGKIKDIIICTNVDFADRMKKKHLTEDTGDDDMLLVGGGQRFKLDYDCRKNEKIIEKLEGASDLNRLANKLAHIVFNSQNNRTESLTLRQDLFRSFHVPLVKKVFDLGKAKGGKRICKFREDFKGNNNLSEEVGLLRKAFESEYLKICGSKSKSKPITISWDKVLNTELQATPAFGKDDKQNTALPYDIIQNEEIEQFFEKLVFAVNQPNEEKLGKLIQWQISNDFESGINLKEDGFLAELVYDYVQKEMLDWLKKSVSVPLSHHDNLFKEGEKKVRSIMHTLPNLLYGCNIKDLVDALREDSSELQALNDELSNFMNDSNRQIFHIISLDKNLSICKAKLYKIVQRSVIYIKELIAMKLQTEAIQMFFEGNLILIACMEEKTIDTSDLNNLCETLISLIDRSCKGKVILLSQQNSLFPYIFQKNKPSMYSCLELNKTKLHELDETYLVKTLLKRTIVFQGHEKTLARLIGIEDEEINANELSENSKEKLKEVLEPDSLSELISDDAITIGIERPNFTDKHSLFYDPYYIDIMRTLSLQKIGGQKLQTCLEENKNDVFVFDGIGIAQLKNLLPNSEKNAVRQFPKEDNDDDFFKGRFFAIDVKDPEDGLKKLRASDELAKKTIHWFSPTENETFILKESDELSIVRDYVDFDSEIEVDRLSDSENSVIVIAGDPGSGKSTLLTTLIGRLDQFSWSITINLNSSEIHIEKAIREDFQSFEGIFKLFSEIGVLSGKFAFEKSLFNYYFKTRKQLILILDGYDEIKNTNQKKIKQLIASIKSKKIKVILASRMNEQKELENSLGIFSYILKPFGPKQQEIFLKEYWIKALRVDRQQQVKVEEYAKVILNQFRELGFMREEDLVGVALQVRMVAEIFQVRCKKYLQNDQQNNEGKTISSILQLFDRFIEYQYNRYFSEKQGISQLIKLKGSKRAITESYTEAHGHLALKSLFPEDEVSMEILKHQNYQTFSTDELTGIGLLRTLDKLHFCQFIHQTYGEYFVAKLLTILFKRHCTSELARKFIVENIFFDRNKLILVFLKLSMKGETRNELGSKWKEISNCILRGKMDAGTKGFQHITKHDMDSAGKCTEDRTSWSLRELRGEVKKCMNWESTARYPGYGYFYNGDICLIDMIFKAFLEETNILKLNTTIIFLAKANGRSHFRFANSEFIRDRNMYNAVRHYITQAYLQNRTSEDIIKTIFLYLKDTEPEVEGLKYLYSLFEKLSSLRNNKNEVAVCLGKAFAGLENSSEKLLDINGILQYVLESLHQNILEDINENSKVQAEYSNILIRFFASVKSNTNYNTDVQKFTNLCSLKKFSIGITHHPNIITKTKLLINSCFEKNNLEWLKRRGVFLSVFLKILTPEMSKKFVTGLVRSYYHKSSPYKDLINYYLEALEREEDMPNVDETAFLNMLTAFTVRSAWDQKEVPLSPQQVTVALRLMERRLKLKTQPVAELKMTIEFIFCLRKAGLMLMNIEDPKILILDPKSTFSFKFSSAHKKQIIDLLQYPCENPSDYGSEINIKCCEMFIGSRLAPKRSLSEPFVHLPSKRAGNSDR